MALLNDEQLNWFRTLEISKQGELIEFEGLSWTTILVKTIVNHLCVSRVIRAETKLNGLHCVVLFHTSDLTGYECDIELNRLHPDEGMSKSIRTGSLSDAIRKMKKNKCFM